MNVAVSPALVEVRRSHLLGLVVAAVALGATSTWALSFAIDSPSDRTQPVAAPVTRDVSSAEVVLAELNPQARGYVEGIMVMTDAELAAAFGSGPVARSSPTTRDVSSAEVVLAELNPDARGYVEGIMVMTDAELAAAFGSGPVALSSSTTRDVSSAEVVLAELNPQAREYVEGIMVMTDAELAAAFGSGPVALSSFDD